MSYETTIYGRVAEEGSAAGRITTFVETEARLIEMWGFLRRTPDREAGWMRAKVMWPEIMRHNAFGDYGDMEVDAPRRLPGLRAVEVDRMDEALSWMAWVNPRDRKLVGVVLSQLDRDQARPSWLSAARAIGWGGHPDTLAKRYGVALSTITSKLAKGLKPAEIHR
jgi:hypothetical protein